MLNNQSTYYLPEPMGYGSVQQYDQHYFHYPNDSYVPISCPQPPLPSMSDSIWKRNIDDVAPYINSQASDIVPNELMSSCKVTTSNRSTFAQALPTVSRRRRQRTNYTRNQIGELESTFILNQYPDIVLREDLASRLVIPESRIQVWFKNRRSRQRVLDRGKIRALTTKNSSFDSPCDTTSLIA